MKWSHPSRTNRYGEEEIAETEPAEGKIPATPEVAARVIGKLVERNWTPEVREVWSVLVSRLKDLSGLPLDEGTTGSPTASGGNAEAPTGVTAPSTAPTTRFPLLP